MTAAMTAASHKSYMSCTYILLPELNTISERAAVSIATNISSIFLQPPSDERAFARLIK